jgi:hypothetical protein
MADEDKSVTGRCLCGDIRYEYRGEPLKILHCHCESCRRHTSSPVATFVCVDRDRFRYTRGEPVSYKSSKHVARTHCGRCGSPMTYESERNPEQVDLYVSTLDDSAAAVPAYHVHADEQLPWFEIADALPRYAQSKGHEPVRHGPQRLK